MRLHCYSQDWNSLKQFRCEIFGFFSSRSLKTREKYISFVQFVYFLRKVCLLFNFRTYDITQHYPILNPAQNQQAVRDVFRSGSYTVVVGSSQQPLWRLLAIYASPSLSAFRGSSVPTRSGIWQILFENYDVVLCFCISLNIQQKVVEFWNIRPRNEVVLVFVRKKTEVLAAKHRLGSLPLTQKLRRTVLKKVNTVRFFAGCTELYLISTTEKEVKYYSKMPINVIFW